MSSGINRPLALTSNVDAVFQAVTKSCGHVTGRMKIHLCGPYFVLKSVAVSSFLL